MVYAWPVSAQCIYSDRKPLSPWKATQYISSEKSREETTFLRLAWLLSQFRMTHQMLYLNHTRKQFCVLVDNVHVCSFGHQLHDQTTWTILTICKNQTIFEIIKHSSRMRTVIVPCSVVDSPWKYPPTGHTLAWTYTPTPLLTYPPPGRDLVPEILTILSVNRMTDRCLWKHYLPAILRAVIILFHSTYLLNNHIRPWQNQTRTKITLPTHDYTLTFHVSAWSNMKLLFRVEKQNKCTAAEETQQ